MCRFITLIVPTDNIAAVQAVMQKNGRAANPTDNPSIRKVLKAGERQYLTTRGHCDCDTVLSRQVGTSEDNEELLRARLKRKKWSEAKIARAIEDGRKAATHSDRDTSDSIDLWKNVLCDLRSELKLPYAGLLVRFYSGAIDTETFRASRQEIAKNNPFDETLTHMKLDEVTLFTLN